MIALLLALTIAIYPQICTTTGAYPATVLAEDFDRAKAMADAFQDGGLQPLIDSNRLFILKSGLRVYLERKEGQLVYIRQPFQLHGVWTVPEALKWCH